MPRKPSAFSDVHVLKPVTRHASVTVAQVKRAIRELNAATGE